MSEIPDPSKISPKHLEMTPPVGDQKPKELPSKKFLTMHMTKSEYNDFLNNYVKMMLAEIKKGEKNMIAAMKKISDPDQ